MESEGFGILNFIYTDAVPACSNTDDKPTVRTTPYCAPGPPSPSDPPNIGFPFR